MLWGKQPLLSLSFLPRIAQSVPWTRNLPSSGAATGSQILLPHWEKFFLFWGQTFLVLLKCMHHMAFGQSTCISAPLEGGMG